MAGSAAQGMLDDDDFGITLSAPKPRIGRAAGGAAAAPSQLVGGGTAAPVTQVALGMHAPASGGGANVAADAVYAACRQCLDLMQVRSTNLLRSCSSFFQLTLLDPLHSTMVGERL